MFGLHSLSYFWLITCKPRLLTFNAFKKSFKLSRKQNLAPSRIVKKKLLVFVDVFLGPFGINIILYELKKIHNILSAMNIHVLCLIHHIL